MGLPDRMIIATPRPANLPALYRQRPVNLKDFKIPEKSERKTDDHRESGREKWDFIADYHRELGREKYEYITRYDDDHPSQWSVVCNDHPSLWSIVCNQKYEAPQPESGRVTRNNDHPSRWSVVCHQKYDALQPLSLADEQLIHSYMYNTSRKARDNQRVGKEKMGRQYRKE